MCVLTLLERLRYGINAAYRSRAIADNATYAFFFFLMPEWAINFLVRYCRFNIGNFTCLARRSDWAAVDEVVLRGDYDIVDSLYEPKDRPTIVDLGANIGMFSLRVFTVCPSAVIHAIEPSSETYQVLTRNKLANTNLTWHLYHAAVWKNDGQVQFQNSEEASTLSAIGEYGNEVVPAISLATLFSTYVKAPVDLLKIDIEGGEEEVICGNHKLLSKVKEIIIEIHPDRCDQSRVTSALSVSFDYLYELQGSRPCNLFLLASRRHHDLPLWKAETNVSAGIAE